MRKSLGSVTIREVFKECNNGVHVIEGCEDCPFKKLKKKTTLLCQFMYSIAKDDLNMEIDVRED